MKKSINKIGLYLLIFIIVLISLFLIGVGYLFLVPKAELFGIVYVKDKTEKVYSSIGYDIDLIKIIEIKAGKYDINIISSNKYEDIRISVCNDFSGFAKTKNSINEVYFYYNPTNDSLVLETKNMSGWVGSGDSKINVIIPEALFDTTHNLKLSARGGCDINVDGFEGAQIGDVEINLYRGDFNFDNLSINNLYIKSNRGSVVAGENVTGEINTLTLDIGRTKVNFLSAGNSKEVLSVKGAVYADIDFKINKLILRSCEKNADLKFYRCDKILSDTGCVLSGGKIIVGEAEMFSIESKDFSANVYYTKDSVLINKFNATGTGSVAVKEVKNICDFKTKSGNIIIEKAEKELVLETSSGNIKLDGASYGVTAITETGNIDISFNEELGDHASNNRVRVIDSLRTASGVVRVYGVDKIGLTVSGSADVYLEFNKVIGTSEMDLNGAKTKIIVPKDEAVELKITGRNCDVNVEVGTTHFDEILNHEYNPPVCYGTIANGVLDVDCTGGLLEIYSANLK